MTVSTGGSAVGPPATGPPARGPHRLPARWPRWGGGLPTGWTSLHSRWGTPRGGAAPSLSRALHSLSTRGQPLCRSGAAPRWSAVICPPVAGRVSLDLVLTGRHVRELVSGTGATDCLPMSRSGLPYWRQIGQSSGPAGWWPVSRCPRLDWRARRLLRSLRLWRGRGPISSESYPAVVLVRVRDCRLSCKTKEAF